MHELVYNLQIADILCEYSLLIIIYVRCCCYLMWNFMFYKDRGIKMNIAVCDDDIKCIDKILQLLQPYKETEELSINTYLSGEEFLAKIDEAVQQDIIFLDIEMLEITGIEVAYRLRKKDSKAIIIFITNDLSYVLDAFRLGAFQFLVKPIDEKIFYYDFERAIQTYKNTHKFYQIRWRNTNHIIVEYEDIYYIEGFNRHLYIYTGSEKGYECVGKLQEEEKKLKSYNFVRCHQGYLVNLSKIREINKSDIVLKNNTKIPVSRRYRLELLQAFNLFLAGKLI